MRRIFLPAILGFGALAPLISAAPEPAKPADKPAADAAPNDTPQIEEKEPVVRQSSVTIDGKKIPYKVTTGRIQLKNDDGKTRASIFHVTYERSDVPDTTIRPVMFAFNGGPGSSAVWLHIGVLGPRILQLPGDGTQAPMPPVTVAENPLSILDVADLVFVDPVSTGYSRAGKDGKAAEFHGLNGDIESVGDFIRRWIGGHERWASPKFILGESYGGVRVAGLTSYLQGRYGMNLNGAVLMSSLLDFSTLQPAQGNDLSYMVYLPSFTGVAHFHKKIEGDRDTLIRESTDFAFGEYAAALLKGEDLEPAAREEIAAKLEKYTGISKAVCLARDLRIDPSFFRSELLRAESKVIGRFDGRVAWEAMDPSSAFPQYDPSYSLAYGAFATAMLDYMGRGLGYKEDRPYEILTGKVQPWSWDSSNQVVNLSDRLVGAMRDNPHLKVLVMGGRTDLATPPAGVAYSIRHMLDLPASLRANISHVAYDGGHMFYLNPPDRAKCRTDLVEFIRSASPAK
jgi:carboxypeptidase C (cathepsin A)